MTPRNVATLLALSMIWGSSFIFLRVASAEMQAMFVGGLRVMFGALFLAVLFPLLKKKTDIARNWKLIALIALFASALPFTLMAFAAQTVNASILTILNATSPIWAALVALAWSRKLPPLPAAVGLGLGLAGVATIVGQDTVTMNTPGAGLGLLAGLACAACYGLATNIAEKLGSHIDPMTNALGCLLLGSAIMLPFTLLQVPAQLPSFQAGASVVAVGVLCSGFAYLLYFRLVQDIGPTSALTVTFLSPVFGVLWGHLLLDEPVGWHTLAGGLMVLGGTGLTAVFLAKQKVAAAQV